MPAGPLIRDVKLELKEVTMAAYVPGGVATCLYQPATPTGGKLPNLPQKSEYDMYIWWAFRGFTDEETFVIR